MQILYLEDSDLDIDILRRYVASIEGCEFASVTSINEAARTLQRLQPDVFLVDIVIKGEMAYQLIEFAMAHHLARYIIPVTARVLPAELERYQSLGCTHIIAKPFTINDLDEVFAQIA